MSIYICVFKDAQCPEYMVLNLRPFEHFVFKQKMLPKKIHSETNSNSCLNSTFTENLHFAGNMPNGTNIPLRSVSIPSQRLYRGPIHCISSILQTEGLQGLYRGAGAMILRDVPGYALYFIPYSIFCNLLKPDATSSPHPCSIWLAGGLAGKKS